MSGDGSVGNKPCVGADEAVDFPGVFLLAAVGYDVIPALQA
jgi:hypothetical protein